jgi:hypothetical protein
MDLEHLLKPRRRDPPALPAGDVQSLPHPDWLWHRLTVSGDIDQLWAFQRNAAGAGVTPWVYDYDAIEEQLVSLMLQQPHREVSPHGVKIIARQMRDLVQEEHEDACAWVGRSQACPFDLHALVPVPWEILRLGPDAAAAERWMWENWGTTWSLRKVRRLPCPTAWRVGFFSADWTPWPVLRKCRERWPLLTFDVTVEYPPD